MFQPIHPSERLSSVNPDADVTYEEETEKGEDRNNQNNDTDVNFVVKNQTFKKSPVRSSSRPKRMYKSKKSSEQPERKKRATAKEIFETNKIEKAKKKGRNKKIAETSNDEFSKIRCRLSPNCLHRATKSMSTKQMDVVRKIGFGKMLEIEFNEIPCKLGYFCVDKYNHETSLIELPIGNIEITKRSIHQMYGLPIGGMKIETKGIRTQKGNELYGLWRKQYGGTNVRPNDVLDKILESEETGWLFVLNFLVLFASTMIEGNQLGSVNTKFLSNITSEDEIMKFDWCEYLLSCLKETVRSWKDENTGVMFVGSISTLVLHYVQATKCGTIYVSSQRSTLAEWTSLKLKEREQAEIGLGGFGQVTMIEENGDGNEHIEVDENPVTEEDSEHEVVILLEQLLGYVLKLKALLVRFPKNKKLLEYRKIYKKAINDIFQSTQEEEKGTASVINDEMGKLFDSSCAKKENEDKIERESDLDLDLNVSEGIINALIDLKRTERAEEEVESVMNLEENRNSEEEREDIEVEKYAAKLVMLKEQKKKQRKQPSF
ncbi:uncharacterized protein [Rutidosis leptorrhynchoides]|uniref:uncharacterized protein n=1 Tax=Rutidosis leptorrhynchoides TaxID=125765 RepID=UPI003A99E70B